MSDFTQTFGTNGAHKYITKGNRKYSLVVFFFFLIIHYIVLTFCFVH